MKGIRRDVPVGIRHGSVVSYSDRVANSDEAGRIEWIV